MPDLKIRHWSILHTRESSAKEAVSAFESIPQRQKPCPIPGIKRRFRLQTCTEVVHRQARRRSHHAGPVNFWGENAQRLVFLRHISHSITARDLQTYTKFLEQATLPSSCRIYLSKIGRMLSTACHTRLTHAWAILFTAVSVHCFLCSNRYVYLVNGVLISWTLENIDDGDKKLVVVRSLLYSRPWRRFGWDNRSLWILCHCVSPDLLERLLSIEIIEMVIGSLPLCVAASLASLVHHLSLWS